MEVIPCSLRSIQYMKGGVVDEAHSFILVSIEANPTIELISLEFSP